MTAPWNHNIHYHPVVLRAVPARCRRALDVGCGAGVLARELRAAVPHVTGIDLDPPSIDLARRHGTPGVDYVCGDVRTHDLGRYDLVASIATLHHMDARAGLARLRELVAPGGRLVVVGLARSRGAADLGVDLAGTGWSRLLRTRRGYWEHSAPVVWPPPETYAGMRRIAAAVLQGCRFRRRLLYRYSITWTAPR